MWGASSRPQASKWAMSSTMNFGQWLNGRRESKHTRAASKQISNNELKSPDMQYTDDGGGGGNRMVSFRTYKTHRVAFW